MFITKEQAQTIYGWYDFCKSEDCVGEGDGQLAHKFRVASESPPIHPALRDYGINAARHSLNCLVSLKTWGAADPEQHCDCEVIELRKAVATLVVERDALLAQLEEICAERDEHAPWCNSNNSCNCGVEE